MKKLYYIAASLLILAGAASCEKKTNVQEPEQELQPSGRMIPFTVTAGQSGQKSSMVDGVLSWTKGDQITVMTKGGTISTELTLAGNGGSATGEFNGVIDDAVTDQTTLYGVYKATYNGSTNKFEVNIPENQTYNATSFQEGIYPSIGTGTYNKTGSTSISFKNPMGILRIKLTGSTSVKSVKITAATSNIAGDFNVSSVTKLNVSGGTSKSITINSSEAIALTSDGVYFNYVTAPFSSQTVNVLVTKSDNSTFSADVTVAVTKSAATKVDVDVCTDACGITYNTTQIGSQIWMTENMRCDKYSSESDAETSVKGATIEEYSQGAEPVYSPYYMLSTYSGEGNAGYLYNWAAAVGVANGISDAQYENRQGICPDGWHLPSSNEYMNLSQYILDSQHSYAGKHLKSKTGWTFYPEIENLDTYGFNFLGVGEVYDCKTEGVRYVGWIALFWTATSVAWDEGVNAETGGMSYNTDDLTGKGWPKNGCASVRCLKD